MDSLFGLDSISHHDQNLSLLTTVYSPVEKAIIESILRDANIPYLIRERGSGGAVAVIAGFSILGTDFFVRNEDLETALILITPQENNEQDLSEDEAE